VNNNGRKIHMSDRGPDNTLPPVTADDYFAAVREAEAAERHMQDAERSHQPNSPTLLSADGALELARETVTALEDRAARQSGLQPHEAAAGVHFGADGTAYMVKERIASEIEAAYAERQAQLSAAPWTGTPDEVHSHYSDTTHSLGQTGEYVDEQAARDWAQNGNPSNGERWSPNSEYSWKGGQLWNDGRYLGEDGSHQPYPVWGTAPQDGAAAEGRVR
jgi:hypothetical protein